MLTKNHQKIKNDIVFFIENFIKFINIFVDIFNDFIEESMGCFNTFGIRLNDFVLAILNNSTRIDDFG
jgi:hypothetical protein